MSRKQRRTVVSSLAAVLSAAVLVLVVANANATHLTSITLGPTSQVVVPGGTATFSGVVNNASDSAGCEYGWNLSASGAPAGSTTTLTPNSKAFGTGFEQTPYTLDITVPAGTPAGPYSVTVTADWILGGCADHGDGTATVTLVVLAGACPADGGWTLQQVPSGDLFDKNGDGYICTKDIPGNGDGNSANSQRGPGQTGYHNDGHNHKDNNN